MSSSNRALALLRLPIVFGTISQPIQKDKANSTTATHQWTVFVRHPEAKCLSPYFEEVVFVLHNSFANHRRVVKTPPYSVTEVGWGEFDIMIELHFKKEAEEQPMILSHLLRLFLDVPPKSDKLIKKPVLSEQFDELIFVNPTYAFKTVFETNSSFVPTPYTNILPPLLDPVYAEFSRMNQKYHDDQIQTKLNNALQYASAHTQNVLYLTQQLHIHTLLAKGIEQARQQDLLVDVTALPPATMGPLQPR